MKYSFLQMLFKCLLSQCVEEKFSSNDFVIILFYNFKSKSFNAGLLAGFNIDTLLMNKLEKGETVNTKHDMASLPAAGRFHHPFAWAVTEDCQSSL